MGDNKKYGLVFPRKEKEEEQRRKLMQQRKTLFDEDDALDEDEDESTIHDSKMGSVKGPQDIQVGTSRANNLQRGLMSKALEEDPNIFLYDEVYDDMKETTQSSSKKQKVDIRPKYMDNLLKSADLRKREQERRDEKKIQKEREAEGDMFGDKEVFVTGAYKTKLQQLKDLEEREMREEQVDKMMDVKKQKDLSGFYRHMLNQQTGEEKVSDSSIGSRYDFKATTKKTNRNIRKTGEQDDGEEESESTDRKDTDRDGKDRRHRDGKRETTSSMESTRKELEVHQENQVHQPEERNIFKKPIIEPDVATTSTMPPQPLEFNPVIVKVPKKSREEIIKQLFTKRCVGELFNESVARYHQRKQKMSIS